jgi:hypothetical protein
MLMSYHSQRWNLLCPECKSEALQLDQITVTFEELLRAVLLFGVVCKLKVSCQPYVFKAPTREPTSLYTKEPLCCEDISQQSTCASTPHPPHPPPMTATVRNEVTSHECHSSSLLLQLVLLL